MARNVENVPSSNDGALQTSNNLVETQDTSVKWYSEQPGHRLTPEIRSFFLQYTGLSDDELLPHLLSIHKRAWELRPYPCIGSWTFLERLIGTMPSYGTMLTRVKNGATILDVGCCMGQDLRKLAADGASTDNMHGCDIETDFWDVGFDLFRDRETFKANYFQADVFDPKSFPKTLQGSVDIIFLGLVHHLWSRREQVEALASLARLTKPGSMILGLGAGWSKGREFETKWKNATKTMYYHDDETMKELWKEVGTVSGTRWKVDASTQRMETFFIESKDWDWLGPEARMSVFEATRMPIDANKL